MDELEIKRRLKEFDQQIDRNWPINHPLLVSIRQAIVAGEEERYRNLLDLYIKRTAGLIVFKARDINNFYGGIKVQAEIAILAGDDVSYERLRKQLGI